jgi:hypothetical protein
MGRPAARKRTSASGRVHEVAMVQRLRRKDVKEFPSAWQEDDAVEVLHFPAFDFAIFAVNMMRVRVGQQFADRGSTRATVRHADHGVWIKATINRPPMPHSRDRRSGIDQHAVHVKQQGTAADCDHFI